MAAIPDILLPHVVTVRPVTGTGAYGPVYGPPVVVRCRLRWTRKLVRNREGAEVVSEATITAAPGAQLPVDAAVYDGDVVATITIAQPIGTIITSTAADDGGLGAWQHHTATI